MTHQFHFWVYIRKKKKNMLIQKDTGTPMLEQHYL